MPKRKRPSPSTSPPGESPTDRVLSRQRKLCTQRVASAQKPLVSALRLGAGFERQKYSRRRKTAKQKDDEKAIARLDAEYAVLKSLDFAKIAEQHLQKTIGKVKSLKDHEGLPDNVRGSDKKEKGETEKKAEYLNVTARLYKVKGVKEAVDECIGDLKSMLEVSTAAQSTVKEPRKVPGQKERNKTRIDEDHAAVEDSREEGGEAFAAFDARIAAPSSADEDSDAPLSNDHRPPSINYSEDELEDWDIETESQSESGDHVPRANMERGVNDEGESDTASFTESDDDSGLKRPREGYIESNESDTGRNYEESHTDELSDLEAIPRPKAKTRPKDPVEKANKSTFLPSLSHGAYFSGSESEASDLDDIAPKKNRRGQRARQKIWELKYKDKAKHIQKQDRNTGWDAKRGAVDDSGGRRGRGVREGMKTGRGPERSGDNLTELGPRKKIKRDDTGPLHPSWQAAKAAKDKKVDVKPHGTKIVFD